MNYFSKRYRIKRLPYSLFILLYCFSISLTLFSQVNISGHIEDSQGFPLEGGFVNLDTLTNWAYTNKNGDFSFKRLAQGQYHLKIELLGYKTWEQIVYVNKDDIILSIQLEEDPLDLEGVIVTGTFDPRVKLNSSVAITTLNNDAIQGRSSRGTADFIKSDTRNLC